MNKKSVADLAEGFGLTLETALIPDHETAFRVYKGVNPIFIGTEEAVREFFVTYEKELPGFKNPVIRGYKE